MEDAMWHIAGDILYGVLLFICGVLANSRRNYRKERSAMQCGLRAILRNDIINIHQQVMTSNCITTEQSENLADMYDAYKALGGNGVITKIMHEIDHIPIETQRSDT